MIYAKTTVIADPGDLTNLLTADSICWLRRGYGLVGFGEIARLECDNYADPYQWWTQLSQTAICENELPNVMGAGLLAFGSFVFDPNNTTAKSVLIVPKVIIGRNRQQSWITRITQDDAPSDNETARTQVGTGAYLDQETNVAFGFWDKPRMTNRGTRITNAHAEALIPEPDISPDTAFRFWDKPRMTNCGAPMTGTHAQMSATDWQQIVSEAISRLDDVLTKVVLARALDITSSTAIDPIRLVTQLSERYRECWSYCLDGLVGATPELLIRLEHGLATSRVLAGTIQRSGEEDLDRRLAQALARSSKNLVEHEFAVASVAEALEPFCSGMNVPEHPYVLELPNVLHLATDINGVVADHTSVLELITALHPSAAVCGTPREDARRVITELEQLDRGRYAGPVGWVDAAGNGEFGIALRCGQLSEKADAIRLFAGCGIVAESDPVDEYEETKAKFIPMQEAVASL